MDRSATYYPIADLDPKTPLQERFQRSVERFARRKGYWPKLCFVNPEDEVTHEVCEVVPDGFVRPGYFYFVVEESE